MKKECFIFTSDENNYGSIYKVLLNDILAKDNVFFLERTFVFKNQLFDLIKRVVFSTNLNIKTNEMFARKARKLLKNKYSLNRKLQEVEKKYEYINVIFFNASIKRFYSTDLLKNIKSKYSNVKFNLFFMDPSTIWASKNAMEIVEEDESLFDNIFTVDINDSRKKGWIHWVTPYSKLNIDISGNAQDLYFCGATKDRHKLLIKLNKALKVNSVKKSLMFSI